MRLVPLVFVCLLFALSTSGQIEKDGNDDLKVDEIILAKDDGGGGAGEETKEFSPGDVPIHCSVLLSSAKQALVRMEIILLRPNAAAGTKIVTVSFKTNGQHDIINFTGRPEKLWKVGNYRVDIFIDGKIAKSENFKVLASPADDS